jgi:hypothetical protein
MTDQDKIDWLLASDPAIRWQVMGDLLGASQETVARERNRVASEGWGADLLSRQDPSGRWAGQLYDHKWISTTYTMLLLRRFGLSPGNPEALRACRELLEGGYKEGSGISFAKTVHQIDLGVVGMVLSLLAYFRYDDPRLHSMVEFLLDRQMSDGSWPPEPGVTRIQYIFAGTMLILEGLNEYKRMYTQYSSHITEALIKGREYLLRHKLYKFPDTGEIIDRKMTLFSFPPRWHYDVLVALDYFQNCNADKDERLHDAIELLKKKRRANGYWPVQNRHPGKTYFEMEKVGQPSKWNTLRALRVLKWWEGG